MHQKDLKRIFSVFRKSYIKIPLEVYKNDPYRMLISTLMSSRTRDETTLKSASKLFANAGNISDLNRMKIRTIQALIFPVGFYKTKAKNIKKISDIILNRWNGKIPADFKKLTSLPGVGSKTANLVLSQAFNIPAIAVDTHVHKISNMLGLVKTKTPAKTEIELKRIVPKKFWLDLNQLFVSIGRQYNTRKKLQEFFEINNIKYEAKK